MLRYHHSSVRWFPEHYLHSFSGSAFDVYHSSLDGISRAYKSSMKFMGRKRLPIALASISLGTLLAASKIDCLEQIGYTTIGGGITEFFTEIRNKKAKMVSPSNGEAKGIKAIQKENEDIKDELLKLEQELKKIRELEEREVEILAGNLK